MVSLPIIALVNSAAAAAVRIATELVAKVVFTQRTASANRVAEVDAGD